MSAGLLVVNAGSSSIKLAVYPLEDEAAAPVLKGRVTGIGNRPSMSLGGAHGDDRTPDGHRLSGNADHSACLDALVSDAVEALEGRSIAAVGHRIVHGGARFFEPVEITPDVFEALEALSPLAPGHQPHNLAGVATARKRWPDALQVACFDTAFHRTQPRMAEMFALPREYAEKGIIRYGFHGLSYEYIAAAAPAYLGAAADGRVIVAHLGHGASLCAMRERESVATTMGFTALDGLVMARRCGALDPGVVLHLIEQEGMTPAEIGALLHTRSGLYGVSGGISDDMRELLVNRDSRAQEAVDLFCYRAAREIGSLAAALGGLDALVFTAGIGEHAAPVREKICRACAWLGVDLDPDANAAHGPRISKPDSRASAWVIPTDEESRIAAAARALLTA